jgi:hypothetical protein
MSQEFIPGSPFYLIKYSDNWADEMDIEGWVILNESQTFDLINAIRNLDYSFTYFCGTNEELDYSSPSHLLATLTFTGITEGQCIDLKALFDGETSFGHTPIEAIFESYAEQSYNEDDEDEPAEEEDAK